MNSGIGSANGFDWQLATQMDMAPDQMLLIVPRGVERANVQTHDGATNLPGHGLSITGRRFHAALPIKACANLLLSKQKVQVISHRPILVARIALERLCRTLAFADASAASSTIPDPSSATAPATAPGLAVSTGAGGFDLTGAGTKSGVLMVPLPASALVRLRSVEQWLVLKALLREGEFSGLLAYIRCQESYQLTRFLLRPELEQLGLTELAKLYGLSYSQFRKLGKQALGASVKAERNRWRAGRALLGLILDGHSVLQVALANGYASASHISTDIKREFGRAPSAFIRPQRIWMSAERPAAQKEPPFQERKGTVDEPFSRASIDSREAVPDGENGIAMNRFGWMGSR